MSSSAVKSIDLVAVIAAAFSSLTLWLIESWIKYIFLIATILFVNNNEDRGLISAVH